MESDYIFRSLPVVEGFKIALLILFSLVVLMGVFIDYKKLTNEK